MGECAKGENVRDCMTILIRSERTEDLTQKLLNTKIDFVIMSD